MKYFTEQWYNDTLVANMCFQLRKSAKAATYSDDYFEKLYKKEQKVYLKYTKRMSKWLKEKYDEADAIADFESNYKTNYSFINDNLPSEISSQIADMRILALGTATYDVAAQITKFCGTIDRKCAKVLEEYENSTGEIAEKYGFEKANKFYALNDNMATRVDVDNDALIIELDPNTVDVENGQTDYFELEDANIICGQLNTELTILCHELSIQEDDSDRLVLSLLCKSNDGEFSEFSVSFSNF